MLKKVAFTMYPVIDLKRATSFYEDNLGLKQTKVFADGSWVEYDLPDGGCFALTNMVKGVSPSSDSGGSIAFEVDDLEQLVADLKTKDVKFIHDAFTTPVCKMAIISDSEGNAVTLHQLKK